MTLPLISRTEAQALHLSRYFSGEKCLHGHDCERYTIGGGCVDCIQIKSREAAKREGLGWKRKEERSKAKAKGKKRKLVNPTKGAAFPVDLERLMAGR